MTANDVPHVAHAMTTWYVRPIRSARDVADVPSMPQARQWRIVGRGSKLTEIALTRARGGCLREPSETTDS